MTSMTVRATDGIDGISARDAARSKNFFALGLVSWMYSRPVDVTTAWIEQKFASKRRGDGGEPGRLPGRPQLRRDRRAVAGPLRGQARARQPGTYRGVNGTEATALGLIAASVRSGLPLFLASYPITPASELLHELSRHRRFGVRTVQAEDEIAASNMALGAAFGGHLGVTATSGPGMDLKAETIGLAVALELPLLVIDIAAGRALDRHADQDRGRRPADGDPRPPRRVAAAGGRRRHPGRVFRRGLRVGAACGPLPHSGDPALRHLPRQLIRALAAARGGRPAARSIRASPPQPNRDEEFWPYLRDERLARPWALPGTRASST